MNEMVPPRTATPVRTDLLRAGVLILVCILAWCAFYNRWTAVAWQTPVTYLPDSDSADGPPGAPPGDHWQRTGFDSKGDAPLMLGWMKAASDGDVSPFHYMDVPELGAPYTANWDDFPLPEKPLFCMVGLLARIVGLFAAANLGVMLGFVFAAVAFYAAGRLLGVSWIWSFAGAIVFAFSHFAFARGLCHITILYFWPMPLWLVVYEWMLGKGGIGFRDRRFLFALAVAAITGVHNVYFMNLFVQFVLFLGLRQAWREGWRAALPAAAILGTAAAAFLFINLDSIVYRVANGSNPGAVLRTYSGLEMFGLKLVDLVVPPPDHRWPLFARWGEHHLQEITLPPGEVPPSGYLGLVGLGALAWLVVVSLRRLANNVRPPLEAFMILWIVLYGGIGGINGILGTVGICLFRATTRYSIFILCLVLMYAARRLSAMEFRTKSLASMAALFCVALAWWDQTPPVVSGAELANTARVIASDQVFVEQMEKRLPADAMVFQLPVMKFPENPLPGIGPYEHLRPYFFARSLRFSFGSVKGRFQAEWQRSLEQEPFNTVVEQLESYGFAAICLNRNGSADHGAAMVKTLRDMGHEDLIESPAGDLVTVLLNPSPKPILPPFPDADD